MAEESRLVRVWAAVHRARGGGRPGALEGLLAGNADFENEVQIDESALVLIAVLEDVVVQNVARPLHRCDREIVRVPDRVARAVDQDEVKWAEWLGMEAVPDGVQRGHGLSLLCPQHNC